MLCVRVDFVLPAVAANAVRYGTARAEWFLNIVRFFHELALQEPDKPQTVVLPNSGIIKTRSRARKSAAGPDLTKLFIGAEGSLGIVTEGGFFMQSNLAPTRYYSDG